ncbi:small-subunit processome [Syncephalis plumigaleata]|nr:small-subunit processome [Syncephalis plumigaleata]
MRMDVFDLGVESPTEDDPTASKVDIDDDEEIDSDDAWNDEDEEKFGQYKFASNGRKQKATRGTDDEEESEDDDDEDEDEYEDEEFVDLSEMLNGGDKTEEGKAAMSSDEGLSSSDEDNDDEQDDDEERGNQLVSFVNSLGRNGKTKRAPQVKERTEVYAESEFNLTLRDSSTTTGKLSLNDLYGALEDHSGLATLKQSMKAMKSNSSAATGLPAGTISAPLAAPLPKRIQQRYDRQVAYEETSEIISQWEPTVKRNREADHVSFVDRSLSNQKPTSEAMAAQLKPTTDMEKQIHEALVKSGMRENEVKEQEELALNKLSIEEVEARRNELRMLRELMFREERKAKRVKKIKSKAYRRIHKKELERQKTELGDVDIDEQIRQAELARAKERMTLRHKNTGKWAKEMLRHGGSNAETRQALMEQLDRHALLKQKIADAESANGYSDSDADLSDGALAKRDKQRALDSLSKLSTNDGNSAQEQMKGISKKGVFAMKFMQDAMKRQADETQRLAEDARRDIEHMDDSDSDSNVKEVHGKEHGKLVQGNPGRRVFDQNNTETVLQQLNVNKKGTSVRLSAAVDVKTTKKSTKSSTSTSTSTSASVQSTTNNPWLDSSVTIKQSSKARNIITQADRAADKLNQKKKHANSKSQSNSELLDTNIDIDITLDKKTKDNNNPSNNSASNQPTLPASSDDEDNNDDYDMQSTKNPNAIKQRDLVERAFANDHVVMEEFAKEKLAEMEADEGKEEEDSLPGWGAWAGAGKSTKRKRPNNITKKTKRTSTGVDKDKRRDAKMKQVIISEKTIKKVKKYAVDAVPFPYKDREQYERSLQQPLGPEWNTDKVFKKSVQPRVETRHGMVIDALE